jgi:hypothetical protein
MKQKGTCSSKIGKWNATVLAKDLSSRKQGEKHQIPKKAVGNS